MQTRNQNQTIIDVRTPAEFSRGHVPGSINIPLQDLPVRMEEIKTFAQPILLCCASGNRSAQATAFLLKNGVACENGGGWMEINQLMHQE